MFIDETTIKARAGDGGRCDGRENEDERGCERGTKRDADHGRGCLTGPRPARRRPPQRWRARRLRVPCLFDGDWG